MQSLIVNETNTKQIRLHHYQYIFHLTFVLSNLFKNYMNTFQIIYHTTITQHPIPATLPIS